VAQSIGERVRALRGERKLTLAELSERAGVSPSYLSQVERDKITPSLVTLTALAASLDVQLRYFFETTNEAAFVVRSGGAPQLGGTRHPERPPQRAETESKGASCQQTEMLLLSAGQVGVADPQADVLEQKLVPAGRARLVITHLQISPGRTSGELPSAPGEEFLFVLAGQISIDVGGESYCLGAGDSLHYDAAQPHSWRNDSAEACSVLWGSAGGPAEL
jgi:transcriptional regulator with XRE-family HTH domain